MKIFDAKLFDIVTRSGCSLMVCAALLAEIDTISGVSMRARLVSLSVIQLSLVSNHTNSTEAGRRQ